MSAAARSKPVMLQINGAGAWKTVIRFDAHDDAACIGVLDAAEVLGLADSSAPTLRVVMDNGAASPDVLMRWSAGGGWKDVVRP